MVVGSVVVVGSVGSVVVVGSVSVVVVVVRLGAFGGAGRGRDRFRAWRRSSCRCRRCPRSRSPPDQADDHRDQAGDQQAHVAVRLTPSGPRSSGWPIRRVGSCASSTPPVRVSRPGSRRCPRSRTRFAASLDLLAAAAGDRHLGRQQARPGGVRAPPGRRSAVGSATPASAGSGPRSGARDRRRPRRSSPRRSAARAGARLRAARLSARSGRGSPRPGRAASRSAPRARRGARRPACRPRLGLLEVAAGLLFGVVDDGHRGALGRLDDRRQPLAPLSSAAGAAALSGSSRASHA